MIVGVASGDAMLNKAVKEPLFLSGFESSVSVQRKR